jgi:2,3-bisphosphoglycerate-independent phosphoglycerate mutase
VRKTIVIHVDGLTGQSFQELGNQTVLQSARTPHLDELARHSELGRLGVPGELRPFSGEMALLALLGYDPHKWYTGPGTFESAALEVVLDAHDVAYLCHLVTLRGQDDWGDGKKLGPHLFMADLVGGGVEPEDARELIDALNEQLVSETIQFYMGHRHRHLMVWVGGNGKAACRNPHEALGQSIDAYLPTGDGSQILRELMAASRAILCHHPVNQARLDAGLKPVNCVWLWGPGKPVELPHLKERWPVKGMVISPDGPYIGVGMVAGLQTGKVENVGEGNIAWLKALANRTSAVLDTHDLVCLHIPFYAWGLKDGEAVPPSQLVEYLQQVDEQVIGAIHQSVGNNDSHRIVVLCTPCQHGQKDGVPAISPYLVFEGGKGKLEDHGVRFNEREVANRPLRDATKLLARFVGNH